MIVLLYTLITAYLTFHYRYHLIYYVLDIITLFKEKYKYVVDKYYKLNGCYINEINIHNNFTFVNYNFSNKSYILYLNNSIIRPYLYSNRFKPNFPYDIASIKHTRMSEKQISSDDDIIYAFVIINDEEIDVTDFCKMISGPKGNFYSDLINVIKPTSTVYHKALIEYIIDNNNEIDKDTINNEYYKIHYTTTFGDEFILE